MKKITLLILILFTLAAQRYAFSQIVTEISSYGSTGSFDSEITIPVKATVTSSTNIGSISLVILFEPSITTPISATKGAVLVGGSAVGFTVSSPGVVEIGWTFGNINLPIGTSDLFYIKFKKVSTGISPLTFQTINCAYSNSVPTPYTDCTYVNGSLEYSLNAPHTTAPVVSACSGQIGQTVSVPVIVSGFNTIGAVSLYLNYNASVLTFVSGSTNTDFALWSTNGSIPGSVTISGVDISGAGVTYPAGSTLFTLTFTYLGGSTDLTWNDLGGTCDFSNPQAFSLNDIPFATYYTNGYVGPTTTTWTGATGTAWTTLTNWSCALPTTATDVIISTSPNYPVIPAAADITVKSLTINDGSVTVSPTAKLTVTNTLTNAVGNTGLVIKSDATGTGSLINNTAGVSATIERYITGSEDLTLNRYHLVSHPFTESYLSGAWLDSYLFDCNEPTGIWIANGIETNNSLSATKGYMIYYPGTSKLYSHTGTMQTGTSTIPVTYTAGSAYPGYNLVANMYPCALDFDVAGNWGGGVISNKIWIWNASSGNYGTHIRSGANTNGVTNIIPEGQGFFVEATTSGDLTIAPAARVHNSAQAFLKNTDITENMFLLKASGNNFSDEIVVQFREDATTGYDELIEAKKMVGQLEAPQLSSVASDDANLSINSLPFSAIDALVPVKFSLNANVDVTFDASGMESFYEGIPIYLEDHLLNTVIDLRANPVYVFSHNTGNAVNRFALRFMGVTDTPEYNEIKGNVFASNGRIFADVPSMSQSLVNISVFDAQGRQISNSKMIMSGTIELQAPSATGVYMVRVLNGSKSFTGRVLVN